jgi:nitroreductase
MIAARSLGLDCGPMSGFDNEVRNVLASLSRFVKVATVVAVSER